MKLQHSTMVAFLTLVTTSSFASTLPSLQVKLSPEAVKVGTNTLDLFISNADKSPVTKLSFTAAVSMRSMDMGTSHPVVKEIKPGEYELHPEFTMQGPWQVQLTEKGFNAWVYVEAGSGKNWAQTEKTAGIQPPMPAGGYPQAPMTMGSTAIGQPTTSIVLPKPTGGYPQGVMTAAGSEMTPIADPTLQPTKVITVGPHPDWKVQTGFGKNAPMVAMMQEMMVGGSGMEGMAMAPMNMKFDAANYEPDGAAPDGMADMKVKAKVHLLARPMAAPVSGDNVIMFMVTDMNKKPVSDATIKLTVKMKTMDMGTTHPKVKNLKAGRYEGTVNFSMAGPWLVEADVLEKGKNVGHFVFTFNAH